MPSENPLEKKKGIVIPEENHLGKRERGRSWFFGIGINQYQDFPKLNNAVKDVEDLLSLLTDQYGFKHTEVITLIDKNATRENILEELDGLTRKIQPVDKLFIYYSGHGHLDNHTQLAYWIPQDAKHGRTSGYIRNSTVRDYIKAIPSLHTLLISDSCFSGSLFVRGASRSTSFHDDLAAIKSRWGLVSGRHDEEVFDGEPGTNSPFAASILKVLRTNRHPNLNVARLADRVIESTRSNYSQLPEGNPLHGVGHEGGQYLFQLVGSEPVLWERCREEHSITAYNDYLDAYPSGPHASEALESISALEEERHWNKALKRETISALRSFLHKFPAGAHAQEARQRIQDLSEGDKEEDESQHWARIAQSGSIEELQAFLDKHPHGIFSDSARKQIKKRSEARWWQKARENNTIEEYTAYLAQFPHGHYAGQAKRRRDELKTLASEVGREGEIRQDWQKALDENSAAAIRTFLFKHPDSQYTSSAKDRLQLMIDEERSWQKAKQSGKRPALQAFLQAYPDGVFANEAKSRIASPNRNNKASSTKIGKRNFTPYLLLAGFTVVLLAGWWVFASSRNEPPTETSTEAVMEISESESSQPESSEMPPNKDALAGLGPNGKGSNSDDEANSANPPRSRGEVAPIQPPSGKSVEEAYAVATRLNTVQGYLDFMDAYPDNAYKNSVREAVHKLQLAESSRNKAWNKAENMGTAEAYQRYLDQYPNGTFAVEAKNRIKELSSALDQGEIFSLVEEMPRFPEDKCERLRNLQEKQACSNLAFLDFIGDQIREAPTGQGNKLDGTVIVRFVVNTDGSLSDLNLGRSTNPYLQREVARVMEIMTKEGKKWIPGRQRGAPVRVRLSIPVRI